jgi:YHS domain-containing protein
MDRLVSFLLFAAFFYLMMRFGCGAHMVHGNHGGHGHEGHQGEDEGSVKDPVCGMLVVPRQGYSKYHDGKTIRFCSKQCLDKFESEPRRYAA